MSLETLKRPKRSGTFRESFYCKAKAEPTFRFYILTTDLPR